MLVSEIYSSRQGEGRLTGQPSIFLRTSGCNLRCDFCDTPYTSWAPEGKNIPVPELVEKIANLSPKHVVVTGGEPMLPQTISQLTKELHARGHHITIETAGTVIRNVSCDLMSISPKLANSTPSQNRAGEWSARHEKARHRPEIVTQLIQRYDYQLKFVVSHLRDLDEIEQYLSLLPAVRREYVMLMPEGIDKSQLKEREKWLRPACEKREFTYCPRMHIEWYGNKRGT